MSFFWRPKDLAERQEQELTGRYFLITPKLLTDLRYHKKMKILNVNNGIWRKSRDCNAGRGTKS